MGVLFRTKAKLSFNSFCVEPIGLIKKCNKILSSESDRKTVHCS